MTLKDFFTEKIEDIRAQVKVYLYRRLTVAVVLVALVLAFGYYRYEIIDPYEQLALSIEEEFSFVRVTHVDRSCVDADCKASFMVLAFYELYSPGEEAYNQFLLRSMNGLYNLSGDTDLELVVGIVIIDTNIIAGEVTCPPIEYFTIESFEDNCSIDQIHNVPIREKWAGR